MNPLTPEQQALAADPRAVSLALRLARWHARREPHLTDEFESAALVGLVHAARTFDPALGDFLGTHLPVRVHGAIAECRRMWHPKGYRRHKAPGRPQVANIRTHAGVPDGVHTDAVSWDLVASADDPVGEQVEFEDEVEGLARSLPKQYAEALRLYHLHAGLGGGGVAAAMGMSDARVYQLLRQAYRWLREERAA